MKYKKAFTMVELIIVIIILAILITIGIISYNGAQAGSRDAKRKSDVNTFVMAMTMYKTDKKTVDFSTATSIGNNTSEGFINKTYTGRTSIVRYLTDSGYLEGRLEDPNYKDDAGNFCADDDLALCNDYSYYYIAGAGGTIYSKLENPKYGGDNDRTAASDVAGSCTGCADFATVMVDYRFAKIIK